MANILDEWHEYCIGKSEADPSHFLGLFKSGLSSQELSLVLKHFPAAAEIQARVTRVLEAGTLGNHLYVLPRERGSDEEVVSAASAWLQAQAQFCKEVGNDELYQIATRAKVVSVSREELHHALLGDVPNSWLGELIGDEVRDAYTITSPSIYGLSEALYGIAADYYLAWYMLQPLIELSLDFSIYFDLWYLGGQSVLTEEELLVARLAQW